MAGSARARLEEELRIGCGAPRPVRAPRGTELACKGWHQEAALRMLCNNLDPQNAEKPDELIVYGGTGKAARDWRCFDALVRSLLDLEGNETLLVQSGKPVGILRTLPLSPRVLIANSNLVPKWATWEHFHELEARGLMMYGQMTAGSWIYIGTQGILQGTYETFAALAEKHFAGTLAGRMVVSAGLGGMGGAQPLAVTMNGGAVICVEVDPHRIQRRLRHRLSRQEGGDPGGGPLPGAGGRGAKGAPLHRPAGKRGGDSPPHGAGRRHSGRGHGPDQRP